MNTIVNNGRNGTTTIVDTTTHTPTKATYWTGLQVLADATFDGSGVGDLTDDLANPFDSVTLPAGTYIEGTFTSVTLTTGIVRMYY